MQYSTQGVVKAMKIQEIILQAVSGKILWIEAAEIIGVSYRTMKRWKKRYKEYGYDGLFDRRTQTPSPKRVPLDELEKILRLYRKHYIGFNVAHFHEKLPSHDIHRSYTFVKKALQTAGLVAKEPKRGSHRKRRPRKPIKGMMLHIDGSPHRWIPALPGKSFDLLVLMDDADSTIYEMLLVKEEDTFSCMQILKNCIEKHGIFCSLYSDRASHFFFTPKANNKVAKTQLTQIGRALTELGITMIPAYSPQARGRSERMFGTLQGRLPQEFKLHNIKTLEEANKFIKEKYIHEHNKRFSVQPEQSGTAFVPITNNINLDHIFAIKHERTVGADNCVQFKNLKLDIPDSDFRFSFAKCRVKVLETLNNTIVITYGPHVLAHYNYQGKLIKNSKRKVA